MPGRRQQFNVNLDVELVRRIKHHAIDAQQSLSDLVGLVLHRHLELEDTMTDAPRTAPAQSLSASSLRLQPMVHVAQMEPAVAFYEALGAVVLHGSRDGDFVMLRVGDTQLGLLAHPPNPDQNEGVVELNFDTVADLEKLQTTLAAAGIRIVQPVTDEGFGSQLQIAAPDGLLVKINRLEPDLYT